MYYHKHTKSFLILTLIFVGCFIFSALWGFSPSLWKEWIVSSDQTFTELLWQVRLPRLVLASLIGLGLSVSGVAFQALLFNPLADPYILGVSGGSALGGVVGVVLGLTLSGVSILAFGGGFLAIMIVYRLALSGGRLKSDSLLLTGIMFNSFSFALILLINALAGRGQWQQVFYWLMGGLDGHGWSDLLIVACGILLGFTGLIFESSYLNIGSLGEETARSLGLNVERHRKFVFVFASLIVGAAVASSGLIGFVGLFVPHLARRFFGADHRVLIPASALLGASILLVGDLFSRDLFWIASDSVQIPVGVLTALWGGPFFIYLLKFSKTKM